MTMHPFETAGATTTPSMAPQPTDPFSSLVDLGTEGAVGVLSPEETGEILEFASDGASVLYSSGKAEDVARGDAAPDLWRSTPFSDDPPELVWRNPARDHSIVGIGGDAGAIAFVEMPLTGERAWNLWFIPRHEEEAILLDTHPGDEGVSSLVPSFSVGELEVVWTAFDRGPDGPVSQLLFARAPRWEPQLLLERRAAEAELWLPTIAGSTVAFTEVVYAADRQSDERRMHVLHIGDAEGPRRVDASGRATMPVLVPGALFWKEAGAGFSMFNWGRMHRYDLESGAVTEVDTCPQEHVNYPSGGGRFLAWWGADSFQFGVHDHLTGESRLIERNPHSSDTSVLRPHLAGDLIVWLRVIGSGADNDAELRYMMLPAAHELRGR